MWLKVAVPLLAASYVGYRAAVLIAIARAGRRDDGARVEHLRAHGLGLHRWLLGAVVLVICLLVVFMVLESR
jgi:hypothetical protein